MFSGIGSSLRIPSSNIPDLFIKRHSEYNKNLRNLESYLAGNDSAVIRGLLPSSDTIVLVEEDKKMEGIWAKSQEQYANLHSRLILHYYNQAINGM